MAESTIPSWVVWVPLIGTVCGAVVGGVISFLASARSSRVAVATKFKEQWISEFRAAVTELMTDINDFSWVAEKEGFKIEEAAKLFSKINRVNLYLDSPNNKLHLAFLRQMEDVVKSLKGEDKASYAEELGAMAVLFREIVHEEMMSISNEIAYPWQRRKARNPAVEKKLNELAELTKLIEEHEQSR